MLVLGWRYFLPSDLVLRDVTDVEAPYSLSHVEGLTCLVVAS